MSKSCGFLLYLAHKYQVSLMCFHITLRLAVVFNVLLEMQAFVKLKFPLVSWIPEKLND